MEHNEFFVLINSVKSVLRKVKCVKQNEAIFMKKQKRKSPTRNANLYAKLLTSDLADPTMLLTAAMYNAEFS